MNRKLFACLLALLFAAAGATAAPEHVILTGGPALRQWENLRVPQDQHDRWWANFIRASTLRMDEIRQAYGPNAKIVWMVYRPGYATRGREDAKPYLTWIGEVAAKRNASLIWIDNNADIINRINQRPRGSITTFDFFGHSNRYCFLLDYGNDIMGACTTWLHQRDLSKLHSSVFARDAYCKSWGCHSGESMSAKWQAATGVPLEGAIGKTDYAEVSFNRMPSVSGRWAR